MKQDDSKIQMKSVARWLYRSIDLVKGCSGKPGEGLLINRFGTKHLYKTLIADGETL